MEQAFELKFDSTRTLEKRTNTEPVEAPEYRETREQARRSEKEEATRAVEQARQSLSVLANEYHVASSPAFGSTPDSVRSHLEAVKESYGIASIMKELASIRAAMTVFIPGTRAHAAQQLYQAQELIGESYLEPHKLGQAERILANLESKLN